MFRAQTFKPFFNKDVITRQSNINMTVSKKPHCLSPSRIALTLMGFKYRVTCKPKPLMNATVPSERYYKMERFSPSSKFIKSQILTKA